MIKIIIVDDHPIIRYGLKQMISDEPDMVVSGEAENASQLFKLLEKNDYNLLLLDIGLPDINGYQVLKRIKSLKPDLPVLILTGRPEYQFIVVMIKEGASGYLNKNETSDHLIEAIRMLTAGGFYISPSLRDRLVFELKKDEKNIFQERLIDIESEIMYLLVEGKSKNDIAESLLLSINAVSAFKSIILKKLNMESESELMRQCVLEYLPHDFSYA